MADQSFCLRWEGFQSNVTSLFDDLRLGDELVDITLCCEGQKIGAHRMMLSACSPYFRDVLKNNPCQHMVFYMKDTSASDLRALVEFMYRGSVNVSQSQLASFIKTAESLQIRGLSGDEEKCPPAGSAAARSSGASAGVATRPATAAAASSVRRSAPASPQPRPKRGRRTSCVSDGSAVECATATPLSPDSAAAAAAAAEPGPSTTEGGGSGSGGGGGDQPTVRHSVKVEKIDLDDDGDEVQAEEEGSLEATLGHVAEYESFDGSNQGMFDSDFHRQLMSSECGGDEVYAGQLLSQSMNAEEGNSQVPDAYAAAGGGGGVVADGGCVCSVCGRRYSNSCNLSAHMAVHQGRTLCPYCGAVSSSVRNLRRHIALMHRHTGYCSSAPTNTPTTATPSSTSSSNNNKS